MSTLSSPAAVPATARFDITHDQARIVCAGDISAVSLSGSKAANAITLSHDGMLKLAFKILTDPDVAKLFPHVALPPEATAEGGAQQEEILNVYGKKYEQQFGEPDQLGKSNVLGVAKRDKVDISWGEGALILSYKKTSEAGSEAFTIATKGPVSLALVVDVMTSFVRDSQTMRFFPRFSAYYLRRWGEEAFDNKGQLKAGIPSQLRSGVSLRSSEADETPELATARIGPVPGSVPAGNPAVLQDPKQLVVAPAPAAAVNNHEERAAAPALAPVTPALPVLTIGTRPPRHTASVTTSAPADPVAESRSLSPEEALVLDRRLARIQEERKSLHEERQLTKSQRRELDSERTELKKTHEKLSTREQELNAEEIQLREMELDLSIRETALAEGNSALREFEGELTNRLRSVTHAEDVTREHNLRLNGREKSVEAREKALDEREKRALLAGKTFTPEEIEQEVDRRFAALAEFETEVKTQQDAVAQRAQQLEVQANGLASQRLELETLRSQLQGLARDLDSRKGELDAQSETNKINADRNQTLAQRLLETESQLRDREDSIRVAAAEVESQRSELSARAQKLQGDQEETGELRKSLERDRLALENDREGLRNDKREWAEHVEQETGQLEGLVSEASDRELIARETERRIGRMLAASMQTAEAK